MKAGDRIDAALLRRGLAPLSAAWQRQARRIDALSLRERVILFVSIAAVLAALFDTLVLSPLSARARVRSELQAQQAAEIAQQREQFVAASRQGDEPVARWRRQLEAAEAERERLDVALRQAGSAQAGNGLPAVLQRLLAQQPGLTLERLVLLEEPPAGAPAASAATAQRPALALLPGMSWQGVELQVQGGYRELQRYLQALERELPGLRWGELHLRSGRPGEAPRLVAQLFLLRMQP